MRELRESLTEMRRITRPVIMGQGYPWGSTVKVCGERGHIGKEYLQLVLGGLPGGGDSAPCSLGLTFSPCSWGRGKTLGQSLNRKGRGLESFSLWLQQFDWPTAF